MAGQLCLRVGARAQPSFGLAQLFEIWTVARLATSPWILVGLASWVVATLLWLVVLQHHPLTLAHPLLALNFVVVPLAAWALLHEPLPPLRVVGLLLITAGVALIAADGAIGAAP